MRTFSINDTARYDTHKEIMDGTNTSARPQACWWKLKETYPQTYFWAPRIIDTIMECNWDWTKLPVEIKQGKEVQWVNLVEYQNGEPYKVLSADMKTQLAPSPIWECPANTPIAIFGAFVVNKKRFYKFLGVYEFSGGYETKNDKVGHSVRMGVVRKIRDEITF